MCELEAFRDFGLTRILAMLLYVTDGKLISQKKSDVRPENVPLTLVTPWYGTRQDFTPLFYTTHIWLLDMKSVGAHFAAHAWYEYNMWYGSNVVDVQRWVDATHRWLQANVTVVTPMSEDVAVNDQRVSNIWTHT